MFAATTDYTKQDIPANITELFKKFTELMLGRWDERKGLKQQFHAPLKDFVLTRIAFHIHSQKKSSIDRREAENIARRELKTRGHETDVDQMLFEIFDRTGFFRIVGEEIEFRHHLLQEFFAGRGIESSDFVKVAMVDEWWKRALVFYFGANPDRIELLREAMDAVSGIEPGKLLEAATTVGLALQACYLSPVSDKLDIWKWVVTALDLCQDAWLNQTSTNKKYPLSEYIQYYLYTRDSVALSHLKQNIASLLAWAEQPPGIVAKGAEKHGAFWLLVGLVESGEISEAQRILQQLTLQDGRIVTAIYLGFSIACQIRPLPHAEKEKAREVCRQMEKQFEPYRAQLLSEFGSALLEMRKGQVKAIDEEAEM